ncbi:MAG: hypothetical protein JXR16_02265 [Bermanella sp.]
MLKKNLVILAAISAFVISSLFILSNNDSESVKIVSNNNMSHHDDLHSNKLVKPTETIATKWQWSAINKSSKQATTASNNERTLPFTAKFVYEALKAVKLDENGNVIYDHDALLSLDEALLRIQNKLDSESLAILQAIIKDGLPGKAGEQTAKIVGDYYHYLEAKDEFSQTSEALANTEVHQSVNAVENDQLLYSELQALRDVHLGNDVSSGLFRVTDADAQYMFESMKLDLIEGLTEEEIQQKRLEIKQQHIQHSVNISNWPDRYRAFQEDKQKILSASLDEQEKQNQVTQLLRSYFSADERKRITHLSLDQL